MGPVGRTESVSDPKPTDFKKKLSRVHKSQDQW